MKKLILSSVFTGLLLAATGVDASTAGPAPALEKGAYSKFAIKGSFGAGYWTNVYANGDSIDKNDYMRRHLIAVHDSKMTFSSEAGCSSVAFGAFVKMNMDPSKDTVSKLFRDVYVWGRFGNVIEVRIGSQRDAMYSLVDAADVMGGTGGYNGCWSALLKKTNFNNVARKDRWVLDLTHANDTQYTNALDIRTTRLAGFQAVFNYKPSEAHVGGLGTYVDGNEIIGKQNNLVSLGVNYDNTFGDFRIRASVGGVYGISNKASGVDAATNKLVEIADQPNSFTYRLGGIFSWKDLDIGLGFLDNNSTNETGLNAKKRNAGKVIHGSIGHKFNSVALKPRVSAGVMYGWANGSDNGTEDSALKNQDKTIAVSATVDLTIREGLSWFVEGTFASLNASNLKEGGVEKGYGEQNVIIGTGLAVSQ